MAMTVMNNSAAQMSLGELNKNINKVGKALTVVAKGQKINGAADDASGYAISEQMRAKLRSLEQDDQNVQNGSAMLKTAAGGIQNIVDELRELKELAIDAANDHNTDDDRRVLQKVFDQKRANIEDIAVSTNYNTKRLLDGTYRRPMSEITQIPVGMTTRTTVIGQPPGVTKIPGTGGVAIRQDNKFPDIYRPFTQVDDSIIRNDTNVYSGTGVECDFGFDGYGSTWSWADSFESGLIDPTDPTSAVQYSVEPKRSNQIGVKIDFDLSGITSLGDLHEEGFAILCGGCGQYMNFSFDASIDAAGSSLTRDTSDRNKGDYVIGIKDVDIRDPSSLAKAIFEGVSVCDINDRNSTAWSEADKSDISVIDSSASPPTEELVSLVVDGNHGLRIAKDPSGGYLFVKDSGPPMDFITKGKVLAVEYPGETEEPAFENTFPLTEPTEINIGPIIYDYLEGEKKGKPLTIHHGTQSNEAINVYIRSMRTAELKSPVPNARDLERLLNSSDFVENNRSLTETTSKLKTALDNMMVDVNQLKRSPLIDIINEIDDDLNREISNRVLYVSSDNEGSGGTKEFSSALDDYPILKKFFEGSTVRPSSPDVDDGDADADTDTDTDTDDDTETEQTARVFDIDKFIGHLQEYPMLQPMLESVIVNHAILNRANGESVDVLKDAVGKTLDDVTFTGTSKPVRTPVQSSKTAIRVIESALDYALEEATNIGAHLARLEYTESNIVEMRDNVTASESAMRDADMARAFTDYTKNNVLAQAAQSMLAQANQNTSSVLGLLQ